MVHSVSVTNIPCVFVGRAPLKLLCDNMKYQILSRAFYGCEYLSPPCCLGKCDGIRDEDLGWECCWGSWQGPGELGQPAACAQGGEKQLDPEPCEQQRWGCKVRNLYLFRGVAAGLSLTRAFSCSSPSCSLEFQS